MSRHPRSVKPLAVLAAALGAVAWPVWPHVSEMGLVLLLPTEIYMAAGAWTVALTVLALALVPPRWAEAPFRPLTLARGPSGPGQQPGPWPSLATAALTLALIAAGLSGSRDPLGNPLPLAVWTVFWIGFVTLQGGVGDLWHWLNPWRGAAALIAGQGAPLLRLPERLGHAPAIAGLLIVAAFAFAHPAPDDPAVLAIAVALWWGASLAGCVVFGTEVWLARGEGLSALLRLFAGLAPWGGPGVRVALPGWRLLEAPAASTTAGLLALTTLSIGSFDGLNETFWWLALIGVNPLEFPGRSAIIGQTVAGLLSTTVLLWAVFAAAVWAGLRLARAEVTLATAFARLAPTVLPIAFGYHIAHYLTTALVNGQYVQAALADPLGTGWDPLGLGPVTVTTGFLNTPDSVETIFQVQAGAVVLGHVLSILLAHAAALRLIAEPRRAAISQIPLAAFMIAYTFLGLWLLAAPKGA
ncbi:MAG: hypothetical protein AAGC57_06625 [Pseudomonadota bacterium]